MTKQLKAFTILEVLISLILTSIIISLTYSLFILISKQLVLFETENSAILEYNLFNTTIKYDIENATDFKIENDELHLKNYTETDIIYSVQNQKILRTSQIVSDTFHIHVKSYRFDATDNSFMDIFKLDLNLLNETINANYYLRKDLSKKINNSYFNED